MVCKKHLKIFHTPRDSLWSDQTYIVARLDPGRDLRVGDEFGEENLPVSEDEVSAAGHHAPLGEHDQRRALPVARQEPPRRVELQRVRVPLCR